MANGFRAAVSNENTANSADVTVTIPATVQANDGLVAVHTAAGTGSTVATPAGWSLEAGPIDKGTALRVYVFSKYATGADAGASFTVSKSTADATKKYLTVAAYSGVDLTDFISDIQSQVESTAGTSHTAPAVTVSGSGNWVAEYMVDRGSPASTDITPPAGFTERVQQVGTGTGTCTTEWCDSNGSVAAGTHSGDSFTGTVSTANAITLALVIKPAGGSPATATPSTVTGAVAIGTPTVLNGANVTVHVPATVVGRAVFTPLVGQVSSTMFPDRVSAIAAIPLPTEQAQQLALVVPELVVLGAVSIGLPTIVAENNTPGGGGGETPPPSGTRRFVGPTRIETWPIADGAPLAVRVTVNQTLYRKNGTWLVGENLNWTDLEGVDRLYQGGATPQLSDAQLDELVAEGQGQYVVSDTDPFAETFTETF